MALRRILLGLVPLLGACSLEASLTTLNPVPSVKMPEKPSLVNVTVTSDQFGETNENQFRVQASSGALTAKIAGRTANGSLILSSTQGAMFDPEVGKALQENLSVPAQ